MSTLEIVLLSFVCAVFGVAIVGAVGYGARKFYTAIVDLQSTLKSIAPALAEILSLQREQGRKTDALPALVDGQLKASEKFIIEIGEFRTVVDRFTKSLISSPAQVEPEPVDAFLKYEPEDAQISYAKQRYMAEGLTPDEAQDKAISDESARFVYSPSEED